MKTAVAITLIIGGVVVVALPPLSDAWHASMVARLLQNKTDYSSINLMGAMEDPYRFGCWLMGALMVSVAVISSVVPSILQLRASPPPSMPPANPQ